MTTFTDQAWQEIAPIITAIEQHPFVHALGDGSLAEQTFQYYMSQDAAYLHHYSRMLALAASQATDPADSLFWANSSMTANSVELKLHESFLGEGLATTEVEPSPTCTAYTSHQAMQGSTGSYACLAASLLPCFWIYEHVGRHLLATAQLEQNPYRAWIESYSDPGFAESSARARGIVDRACSATGAADRTAAMASFVTSSRYEWMFWDAAWRREEWPV
ncbi:MAG TPA: TenA family protein [Candidatus Avipropionibacterium avicola]|uniref:TenA family protein n=1 Tax=Candidatus Avipropionibacterium avicola TaxID=2840701 RepID=A0A9D1GYS9_9ACTN|nr:TenA family protein [Candidatus Avipropionibacterium avicola]